MASRITFVYALILLVLISSVPLVMAGTNGRRWNNPRDLDPIIITGKNIFGLSQLPINELYVFAYNASENTWRPAPFQFDERDNTSDFWLTNPNGIFDDNDELVFMAKDMGDQAPDGSFWIDDSVSRGYDRVEITATDTVDGRKAWVYVYRSTNPLALSSEFYMDYKPDSDGAGADTIIAKAYIEGHNSGGIPTEWRLQEGIGPDILDRLKVRVVFPFLGSPFTAREDLLESFFLKVEKKIGQVRVLREVFWYINFLSYQFLFSLPLQYYPYSIESGGVSGSISTDDHVSLIRQSFDLTREARGMKFYNPNNQAGITIDGKDDDGIIIKDLADYPAVNWYLITGNQGSFAFIFTLPQIGDTRSLYFKDDSTVVPEDEDSGDRMSWGDTGIIIEGTDIEGNISFAYKAYYLGPNESYSQGETLANNFEKPLKITMQTNYYVPVELSSFIAIDSDGKVVLEWVTESETNNYEFEIQRKSQDSDNWEKIASVKGHGTTTIPQKYSFIDHTVTIGTYYYRLKQIDFDGNFEYMEEISIEVNPPRSFSLYQNYPNPFNPETVIRYQIPKLSQAMLPVELKIYNLLGDEVKTLVQNDQDPGFYSIEWDGKNNQGKKVTAGTYIYRLKAGEFIKTKKMLLLR